MTEWFKKKKKSLLRQVKIHPPAKVAVLEHPQGIDLGPSAQPDPALAQLCALPLHPALRSQDREWRLLCVSPPQEIAECGEASSSQAG